MERDEAMQSVAASLKVGAGVSTLVPQALELCRQLEPHGSWDAYKDLNWSEDARHCRDWFERLLQDSTPGPAITGFWFGIFNPVRQGHAASDFYVTGSAQYPSDDWIFSQDWEPIGRYAYSPAQSAIYGLADSSSPHVLAVVDYILTFAHAAATVNDLMHDIESSLWLGGSERRGVAVGHDSGDALFLGELSPQGLDRSAADWV